MNDAPAHIHWVARLAPQTRVRGRGERFPTDVIAPMLSWPEVVASGEITNWSAAARGEFAAGIAAAKAARRRVEGHNAGASYDRLAELSRGRHLLRPRGDHRRGGAAPPAARDVDDAAQLVAAAGPGAACCEELAPVIGSSRRLMLTTDGAVPSLLRRARRDRRRAADRAERGVDPMRALQMATIDPATFLLLDEELGGIAPGRRATFNVLPEIGEWRPERVFVDGREVARDGRLTVPTPDIDWPAGPGLVAPPPEAFAPLTGIQPVARYESAVINRRHDSDVARDPGGARRPRRLVDHQGRRREPPARTSRASRPPRRRRSSCSCSAPTPAAMARAAAKVAEMGGGFAFDGGWSAPLEIDGLIAAGGFDRALRIERELTEAMLAAGYPFHDPLYSLLFASGDFLPELRLTPIGRAGGEVAHRCTIASHAWRRCSSGVSPSPCRSASAGRSRTPLPASPSTPSRSGLPRTLTAPSRPRTPRSSRGGRRALRGAARSSTAARGSSHDHIGDLAPAADRRAGQAAARVPARDPPLRAHARALRGDGQEPPRRVRPQPRQGHLRARHQAPARRRRRDRPVELPDDAARRTSSRRRWWPATRWWPSRPTRRR